MTIILQCTCICTVSIGHPHDDMAYNSTEIVWNAELKDVVYKSLCVLAFIANLVEIRMASNGSLIQTIAVPDLRLLSKKVKYQPNFHSSRLTCCTHSLSPPSRSLSSLPLSLLSTLLPSSPHHRAISIKFSPE